MAWADYKRPSIDIDLGSAGKAPVYGLDLEDLTRLVNNHLEGMTVLAEQYQAQQGDVFDGSNLSTFIGTAAKLFPDLAREVIALGAGDPEVKDIKLALSVEMAALSAILKLTIEDAGGLGNLLGMFGNVLKGAVSGKGQTSKKLKATLSPSSISGSERT